MTAVNMLNLHCRFASLCLKRSTGLLSQQRDLKRGVLEKLGIPERPKRPLTPYFRFMQSIRPELKKEHPQVDQPGITKLVKQLWDSCPTKEKKNLENQYKIEMQQHKLEIKQYEESLTDEQKRKIQEAKDGLKTLKAITETKKLASDRRKELKLLRKPKKPQTAFFRFAASLQSKRGTTPIPEHSRNVAKLWKALSETEKEKYQSAYKADNEIYLKELEEWEKKMIEIGRIDVVRTKSAAVKESTEKIKKNYLP